MSELRATPIHRDRVLLGIFCGFLVFLALQHSALGDALLNHCHGEVEESVSVACTHLAAESTRNSSFCAIAHRETIKR
jgi:hypothetical protein